jgi:hypothetical protein
MKIRGIIQQTHSQIRVMTQETALIPEIQISCSSDLEWNLSLNHTDYKDVIFYKFMLCNISQNGQDKTQ